MRRVTAPGKLVFMGEYAVLAGAPGIVVAVDRRAEVCFAPGDRWCIHAPLLGLQGAPLEEARAHPQGDLLSALLCERGAWSLQTDAFHEGGHKLGLGSSAALAAAAALAAEATPHLTAALARHGTFSPQGSGIDVAASVLGGVLRFQRGDATPLPWHGQFAWIAVHVGFASDTRALVATVVEKGDLAPLVRCAEQAMDAWLDADSWMDCVSEYASLLALLGQRCGVDIVSAPHRWLASLAGQMGGAYKPSGAGGGDMGVAFLPEEHVARFRKLALQSGLSCPSLAIDPAGARLESAADSLLPWDVPWGVPRGVR
jgi:phosphomevalonate kinase